MRESILLITHHSSLITKIMGQTRHEKSFVDFDKPYERNIIGLRGIIYFGIGLFLLIVVTFGLMWFLQNVMEERAAEADRRESNPMMMNDTERLPPEPRLQAAPGFGVDSKGGRVNLELQRPQAEYEVLREQWNEVWKNGQKADNGAVVTLPIEQAKERLLQQNVKAATGEQGEKALNEARTMISDASSGRQRSQKIR